MNEELKSIIDHYGKESQIMMVLEEIAELQKELCKDHRGKGDITHIIEEVADVEIMLEQVKIIYGITPRTLEMWKKMKIERTLERIGNE